MHRKRETRSKRELYYVNVARLPRTRRIVRCIAAQKQYRREQKQLGAPTAETDDELLSAWLDLLPGERAQFDRCALKAGYKWPRKGRRT
jgi:hypothetical protein